MFSRYAYDTVDGVARRSRRCDPVTTPLRLTVVAAGREYSALIADISLGGGRVRFDGPTTQASNIDAAHTKVGSFRSHRRWTSGDILGCSFDHTEVGVQLCVHCL
jgi:hypothetical protein